VGLPLRRLPSLPRLRMAWLRVRWLRGLRRLLRIVGTVPLVLGCRVFVCAAMLLPTDTDGLLEDQ